jgi:hypothetical protein
LFRPSIFFISSLLDVLPFCAPAFLPSFHSISSLLCVFRDIFLFSRLGRFGVLQHDPL